MIAAIVPAHNEEEHIGACVESLRVASRCAALAGEEVLVVVALDACTDRTQAIALSQGACVVTVQARNVGVARAVGAEFAMQRGARWLSFTDADTVVAPGWFSSQLALATDAVCGTIGVSDWEEYGPRMQRHFADTYVDADHHRHIHGANLGVSANAYRQVGGFQPLATSEDVALVEALREGGINISWSAAPRVFTSARKAFRAPGGFGATLLRLDGENRSHAEGALA